MTCWVCEREHMYTKPICHTAVLGPETAKRKILSGRLMKSFIA